MHWKYKLIKILIIVCYIYIYIKYKINYNSIFLWIIFMKKKLNIIKNALYLLFNELLLIWLVYEKNNDTNKYSEHT